MNDLKHAPYPDTMVSKFFEAPIYWEPRIRDAAQQRGFTFTDETPLSEVIGALREQIEGLPFRNHKNEIERQIIVLLVRDCLAAGYSLGVNDGEETTLEKSTDETAIFAAMSSTDEDFLLLTKGLAPHAMSGWIRLIYGNGADVISDNTTNIPDAVLARAEELAERFQ